MFGRNKKLKKENVKLENVRIMPEVFYGGKDPVVHFTETEITGNKNKKKGSKKVHKTSGNMDLSFFGRFFGSKLFIYIVLGLIFLLVVIGISWYYLNQAGFFVEKTEEQKIDIPQEDISVIEPEVEDIIEKVVEMQESEDMVATSTPETPVESIVEKIPYLEEQNIVFPRIILTDSADIDSDSLTDLEEEIFDTDSGVWDTDDDGYYDGEEVSNLYNPRGVAPVKLVDSGLVQDYVNPKWQYRVYYPIAWERGSVGEESRQILFSSITGDFVETLVFDLKTNESFSNWFSRKAEGQKYSDIKKFSNRFEEEGYKRNDGLVAYFINNQKVYILIYHPGVTGFIPFRHTMGMMINSFRTSKSLVSIPEQTILPPVPNFDVKLVENEENPAVDESLETL